jgi:beta-glucosidase/6-phospho-beta-glucosidase/beta-galactosidase
MGWEVYPEGFYHLLRRLQAYGQPIYVTENGISTLDDDQRCRYLLRHLREMGRAISEGADVRGYLHWTLTDNFEWAQGYYQKFGIVAMEPNMRERRPRPSAYLYRDIAQANAVRAEQFERYLG